MDENLLERTYHIESGFGLRQLTGAGISGKTWLNIEVDDLGLVKYFEVKNHDGLTRDQESQLFGEAGHGENDYHPSEVV